MPTDGGDRPPPSPRAVDEYPEDPSNAAYDAVIVAVGIVAVLVANVA